MKQLILGLMLLGSSSYAQEVLKSSETQSTPTRALPTVASFTFTSGSTIGTAINLYNVVGYRVSVCAESGQTLSGAGTLDAYLMDERDSLVKPNPALNETISVVATSCAGAACRCQQFPDHLVTASMVGGWVMYAIHGVTISGGTTAVVKITAWRKP